MGTNLIRAMLLASSGVAAAAGAMPTAAYAQEASYQIDIPAQSMGDALRALGKATKQNIVFNGSLVKGKRSAAVRGRMSASAALEQLLSGSGLKMSRGSAGGLVVQAGNDVAAPARTEASASGSNVVAVPSASASTVVDARTGAALKGALVEIVETGEKTSTGDLGEFRFPGKAGSFNLRISYLGYPVYEQFVELKDGRATSGILLSDGSASGEIVVTAYQSARAQALNQERAASNVSTVISSDLLGQFEGTTISDALRKASGVSFQPDPETGEGANVSVRGLAPDFNMVTLNGVRVPVGNGLNRSPSLGNILADSVSSVTINKTLTASQDSAGTGGLIEIETKGPLDRPARYFSISAEGAGAAKGFDEEKLFSGTASFTFGTENPIGVSISAQYRDRSIKRLGYSLIGNDFGEFLPRRANGTAVRDRFFIDPTRAFPFFEGDEVYYPSGLTNSSNRTDIENLGINASLQWKIGNSTNLRLDYTRTTSTTDNYGRNVFFSSLQGYTRTNLADRPDVGAVYGWTDYLGAGNPGNLVSFGGAANYSLDQKEKLSSLSFRGTTDAGKFTFKYGGALSKASSGGPNSFLFGYEQAGPDFAINVPSSWLTPEALANTRNGRLVSLFAARDGRGYALPLLTDEALEGLSQPSMYKLTSAGDASTGQGKNNRKSVNFSAKYSDISPFFRSIEAGLVYERSRLQSVQVTDPGVYFYLADPSLTLADLGIAFADQPLRDIGIGRGFNMVGYPDLIRFTQNLKATGRDDPRFGFFEAGPSPFEDQTYTNEDQFSGYVQAELKIGKFDINAGLRIEKARVETAVVNGPSFTDENGVFDSDFYNANSGIVVLADSATDYLPRILINFRPTENFVVRAGYYNTVARPSISQLNAYRYVSLDLQPLYGPNRNQPTLSISEGNPGLRPAITDNFDVSLEYYDRNVGVMKLGAFLKRTRNSFFDNRTRGAESLEGIVLPEDPRFQTLPSDIFIQRSRPENEEGSARLWGIEASLERRLTMLPAPLDGLGVYANFTLTRSKKRQYYGFVDAPSGFVIDADAIYPGQVGESGTIAVTYARGGVDSMLSFTRQSRYLTSYGTNRLDYYQEAVSSLDFRVQYQTRILGAETRLFLVGSDLLKGVGDADIETSVGGQGNTPKYYIGGNYIGGRNIRLGLSLSF